MKKIIIVILAFYSIIGCAKADYKHVAIKDKYAGDVTLSIPKGWMIKDVTDINDSKYISYKIISTNNEEFIMTLVLNRQKLNPQFFQEQDKASEDNIFSLIEHGFPGDLRAGLKFKRFGKLAAFGRVSASKPIYGRYMFFTQGQKNIGDNKITFGLLSNDKDEGILNEQIKIVDSVEFKN